MEVYLLCGVPGSGKSWVAHQVKDQFHYIPHDAFASQEDLVALASKESKKVNKPMLIDCPFNERAFRSLLEGRGLTVTPIFIIETPAVIKYRYFKREGRVPGQNVLTRAESIKNKVREWNAFHGTSEEVLRHLRHIGGV